MLLMVFLALPMPPGSIQDKFTKIDWMYTSLEWLDSKDKINRTCLIQIISGIQWQVERKNIMQRTTEGDIRMLNASFDSCTTQNVAMHQVKLPTVDT